MPAPRKSLQAKLYGWWYVCLGLGFAALAWRNWLLGGTRFGTVIRCLIALGFLTLGIITLRGAAGMRRDENKR